MTLKKIAELNKVYLATAREQDAIDTVMPPEICEDEDPDIVLRHKQLGDKGLFRQYHKQVWIITNGQPLHTLENFHLRGFKSYHLDHKISIWHGFKNNIPAEEIGNILNLRMIHHKENMLKGKKSIGLQSAKVPAAGDKDV